MEEKGVTRIKGLFLDRAQDKILPRLSCAHCGSIIARADMALITTDWDGIVGKTVHRACDEQLPKDERMPMNQQLDTFLLYLLGNTGLLDAERFDKAKEKSEALMAM
jgi:hypothetical protein